MIMPSKWLDKGVLVLCVLGLACSGYVVGFQTASKRAEKEKAEIINTYQASALSAAQMYSDKLKEAVNEKQKWFDFAQTQSKQLVKVTQELNKTRDELQEKISNAVQNDGSNFTGIGADSVQLYNRAYGYTDSNH